jgi:hypothetical protein
MNAEIPANMPQRITNVGEVDLVFLALCNPRFVQSAYVSGRQVSCRDRFRVFAPR